MNGDSEYLLALYRAERRADGPVSPGAVADAVGRSPAATTEMLQRLEDRGLVAHEPYEGATLTADGRDQAEKLHGTFVTLSRFFRDVLELEAHEKEAMALAGALSPAVADRLDATLLADSESTPAERSPTPDSE